MIINKFALVIKETKHAALLMALPSQIVSDDSCGTVGYEVPLLNETALAMQKADSVWRTKRKTLQGRVSYWDGSNSYHPWNG